MPLTNENLTLLKEAKPGSRINYIARDNGYIPTPCEFESLDLEKGILYYYSNNDKREEKSLDVIEAIILF